MILVIHVCMSANSLQKTCLSLKGIVVPRKKVFLPLDHTFFANISWTSCKTNTMSYNAFIGRYRINVFRPSMQQSCGQLIDELTRILFIFDRAPFYILTGAVVSRLDRPMGTVFTLEDIEQVRKLHSLNTVNVIGIQTDCTKT